MTYITLAKASEDYKIPKRTLQSACEAGHLKFEWREPEAPVKKYMVTTAEWISEWVSGNKKRTRQPKTKTTSL